jgi:Zn-finger nucleic acid-binding protein
MICPNENVEMHQVRIESHYGQPIILEQCKGCGGIWFDESELFSAKQGEAEKIELLDSEILRTPSKIEKSVLKCPRDQAELFWFNDRYFPKGIILERCPSCNGIWLNRGHFTKFQKARQELQRPKEKSPEDKKMEEDIERILALHQAGGTTDALRKLGRFLSTPLDRKTLLFLEANQRQPEVESTVNLALNVLMLVFRALILK